MKKSNLIIVLILVSFYMEAQDFSALWKGHFSYLNIKDAVQSKTKIYAASENAIFTYDLMTLEIDKISTIHGLSGEFISTIHYSEAFELLIIGYENGLIEIVLDQNEDILSIVDILEKQTIPPDNKRINHFNEFNGLIYISTDFGISVYNLERLEFGDTFFIGNGGAQIIVKQTTVFGDYLYAACLNNEGIKKALVNSNNLINYQEWSEITEGNFTGIEALEDKLFTTRLNNSIHEINNDILSQLFTYSTTIQDLKSSNNNLVVTTKNSVFVYDSAFNLLVNPLVNLEFNTQFTASIVTNGAIYIGTENFGVLSTTMESPTNFIEIHPNGPLKNNTFSVDASFNKVWATYGDYTEFLMLFL